MANRIPGGLPPNNFPAVLERLLAEMARQNNSIRLLQEQQGRTLPDDFRFGISDDGSLVQIERVSTGEVVVIAAVTPPVSSVDGETGAVELPGYADTADPDVAALRTLGPGHGQAAPGDDPRFAAIGPLSKTAGADLSADRVVRAQADGTVVYASNLTPGDALTALWLTLTAASAGDPVTVLAFGEAVEITWTWDPTLPIFLGVDGVLTQTPPTSPAFLVQVASCIDEPTRIQFAPHMPVQLA